MSPIAKSVNFKQPPTRKMLIESLELDAQTPDLFVLFGSAELENELVQTAQHLRELSPSTQLVGCSAEGVLAGDREFEDDSQLVLMSLHLPAARLTTFPLDFVATREGHAFTGWPSEPETWDEVKGIVALGDPFSFPMDAWLERMNEDRPALPIVGGMCSGGHEPGGSCLLWNDEVRRQGAILVFLRGDFELTPVVSQGCRPLGEPLTVTRAERNLILELDGRPALRLLHDLFLTLPTQEQASFRHGLQLGRAIPSRDASTGSTAFLIRNIVGCDSEAEGVIVADHFFPGERVQFHLRDESTATSDLSAHLRQAKQSLVNDPTAALLFSCNGRGTRMFSEPDHDVRAVRKQWPHLPLAGCQAAGEIGPVGQHSFVHGHTASLLLFHKRNATT